MRLNLTKEEIHTRGGMLDHMMDALPNPSILVDEKGIVQMCIRDSVCAYFRILRYNF